MTIKRLDHISVVVDDLPSAKAFFIALGMTVEGEAPIEGPWVDRVNGIEGVQVDIVMMRTPDGHGKLELTKFRNPRLVEIEPAIAPPNAPGLRSAGHDHFYERIKPQKGIYYFVSGAGGKLREGNIKGSSGLTEKSFDSDLSFMLFEVVGKQMYSQLISRTGETVDSGLLLNQRNQKMSLTHGETKRNSAQVIGAC